MHKRNHPRKLALSLETLRQLRDAELGDAVGGLDTRLQCQKNTETKFPVCQWTAQLACRSNATFC